jgi:hypothetical protein
MEAAFTGKNMAINPFTDFSSWNNARIRQPVFAGKVDGRIWSTFFFFHISILLDLPAFDIIEATQRVASVMPYPTTGPDVLVAVESGAASAAAWSCLSRTCTSASIYQLRFCCCCGFLRFRFGVGFEPVTDFYPATSDEQKRTGDGGEVQQ